MAAHERENNQRNTATKIEKKGLLFLTALLFNNIINFQYQSISTINEFETRENNLPGESNKKRLLFHTHSLVLVKITVNKNTKRPTVIQNKRKLFAERIQKKFTVIHSSVL